MSPMCIIVVVVVAGAYIQTRPGGACQRTNSIAVAQAANAVMTMATHPPMPAGFRANCRRHTPASDTIEHLHMHFTCLKPVIDKEHLGHAARRPDRHLQTATTTALEGRQMQCRWQSPTQIQKIRSKGRHLHDRHPTDRHNSTREPAVRCR